MQPHAWLAFSFTVGVWSQLWPEDKQINVICTSPMRAARAMGTSELGRGQVTEAQDIIPSCLHSCSQQSTGKIRVSKPQIGQTPARCCSTLRVMKTQGPLVLALYFLLVQQRTPGTIKQQMTQVKYSGHKPSNFNPRFDSANGFKVASIFSPWISSTDFS